MNNFGVVEVASQRRAVAPGWAYVPERRNNALLPPGFGGASAGSRHQLDTPQAAADDPNKPRKRAARSQTTVAGNSLALFSDLTSRQETKLRKELEVLGRDMGAPAGSGAAARDAAIPIPARATKAQNRYTPNVRKILASQKTFANYLDDFNAFNALHGTTQGYHANHGIVNESAAAKTASASTTMANSRRLARKDTKIVIVEKETKDAKEKDTKSSRNSRRSAAARRSISAAAKAEADAKAAEEAAAAEAEAAAAAAAEVDTPMQDAEADAKVKTEAPAETGPVSAILRPYDGPKLPSHPRDTDPLIKSVMPQVPPDDTLRALVTGPQLPYPEARATLAHPTAMSSTGRSYPTRVFCEICGYWGRVKCTKCGTPVCALDCLEMHRQECITRYGL